MFDFLVTTAVDPDKTDEDNKKFIKMPGRRSYGSKGRSIVLRTNYLKLNTSYDGAKDLPVTTLHRYHIAFTRDLPSAKKRRMVEYILLRPLFDNKTHASDFANIIITTERLDLDQAIKNKLLDDGPVDIPRHRDDSGGNPRTQQGQGTAPNAQDRNRVSYRLEYEGPITLEHMMNYLRSPTAGGEYSDQALVLQLLNIIVAKRPHEHTQVTKIGGNKFYPFPVHPAYDPVELQRGLLALRGYFSSVRPAVNRLLLNLNVTSGAFYRPGPLLQLIRDASIDDNYQLEAFLHLLKVKVTYRTAQLGVFMTRVKTIYGFSHPLPKPKKGPPPIDVPHFGNAQNVSFQFQDTNQTPPETSTVTVQQYYRQEYNITLAHPTQKVLNVGTRSDPIYIPPELCEVLPGQPYRRILTNAGQTQAMLRFAARAPNLNANSIFGGGQAPGSGNGLALFKLSSPADQAQYIRAFGISAATTMLTVPGRILDAPKLNYGDKPIDPKFASWNLEGRKFAVPGRLGKWRALVIHHRVQNGTTVDSALNYNPPPPKPPKPAMLKPEEVFNLLGNHLVSYGVAIDRRQDTRSIVVNNLYDSSASNRSSNERQILKEFDEAKKNGIQVLLIVLPIEDKWLYSRIKFYGDVKYGINTINTVGSKFQNPSKQGTFLANLALKFNIKGGGVAHKVPGTLITPLDNNTILFGIDVTHPSPGSRADAPSISAVVASVDQNLCQWPGSVRTQTGRQEMVQGLTEMVTERLDLWQKRNNNRLPTKVILYRDGVSEGQYAIVLDQELPCFEAAFMKKYGKREWWPKMTIIIVGKRHHTRFYPTDSRHADQRSFNPLPGTIVDRGISGRILEEFWLQAHQGLQGTARPAHYVVIKDDVGFEADQLQGMTHQMCYLFNRATKAVSICPPAYYADLLCERGRAYLFSVLAENNSPTGAAGGTPALEWTGGVHPNLQETTWYV